MFQIGLIIIETSKIYADYAKWLGKMSQFIFIVINNYVLIFRMLQSVIPKVQLFRRSSIPRELQNNKLSELVQQMFGLTNTISFWINEPSGIGDLRVRNKEPSAFRITKRTHSR